MRRLAILILVVIVAAGCTRIAYHFADWIALYEIERFLDLDAGQKAYVQARLAAHHEWHRRIELASYAQLLQEAAARATDGLSAADLEWAYHGYERHRRALAQALLPDASRLLAGLSPEQIEHFDQALVKHNGELIERLQQPPEQRARERADALIERLEGWFGALTREQKSEIRLISAAMPDWLPLHTPEQQSRRQALIGLLRQGATPEEIERLLGGWWVETPPRSQTVGYERERRQWHVAVTQMALKIDTLVTVKQRRRALRRLEDLAETMAELAEGANEPQRVEAGLP